MDFINWVDVSKSLIRGLWFPHLPKVIITFPCRVVVANVIMIGKEL